MIFKHERHVDRLPFDVAPEDVAIGVGKLQRHFRECLLACCNGWTCKGTSECRRHSQSNGALSFATTRPHDSGEVIERMKNFARLPIEKLACRGRTDAARTTMEKGHAQT